MHAIIPPVFTTSIYLLMQNAWSVVRTNAKYKK